MSKAKNPIDLINEAASKKDLTPRETVLALGRLALHLGANDPDKLKVVGPALGNIAQGIGKVAAAEAKAGSSDGASLLDFLGGMDDED